jgi:hypothetical protein
VLLCLLIFGVPLGLFAWWVWPRPPLPRLLVVTFDEMATPGEAVTLRAQLRPAEGEPADARLDGQELYFSDPGGARLPGQEPWQLRTTSGPGGVATAQWQPPPGASVHLFRARLSGDRRRPPVDDQGRVFLWPRETPLLVVEVEPALTDAPASAWEKQSVADIRRPPEPADALQAAEARKYRVVYLALTSGHPLVYHKVRDWAQMRPGPRDKALPLGPVLGRPSYAADMDAARARREVLDELKKQFQGPRVAVTRQPAAAEAYRDAGFRTFLITADGAAPQGVTVLKQWPDLASQLGAAAK